MGLETAFESAKRYQKTNAATMIINSMRFIVQDYTVAQISDLLTQASGQPLTTNSLKNTVALVREATTQSLLFE
jgi:hypothetical protein